MGTLTEENIKQRSGTSDLSCWVPYGMLGRIDHLPKLNLREDVSMDGCFFSHHFGRNPWDVGRTVSLNFSKEMNTCPQ